MKKRTLTASIAITLVVLFLAVITASSQEYVKGVQDSGFKKLMRPTVPFAHDEHNEKAQIEECSTCHHVYEDGKLLEGESSQDSECSECHQSAGDRYALSLVKAYHGRCKGCHDEKQAGPIMCADCHVR